MVSHSSSRPRLQSRAFTDFGPLVNPAPIQADQRSNEKEAQDLGQGTQVFAAGRRLTGSTLLPEGACVPVSPFLPLPPAPTAEELVATTPAQGGENAVRTPTARSPLRSSSSRNLNGVSQFKRAVTGLNKPQTNTSGGMGMIRSYSLPVATQREFDQQCRAFAEREADEAESHSFLCSSGWPGSADCLGVSRFKKRLHRQNSNRTGPSSPRSGNQSPRSPLSPLPPSHRTFSSSSLRTPISLLQQPTSHLAVQVFEDSEESCSETEDDLNVNNSGNSPLLVAVDESEEVGEMSPCQSLPEQWNQQDEIGSYFAPRSISQDSNSSHTSSYSDELGPNTPKAATAANVLGLTPLPTPGIEHSFSSRFRVRAEVVAGVWVGGKGSKQGLGERIGRISELIHPDHLAPPPALTL